MIRAALLATLLAGPALAAPLTCPRILRTEQEAIEVPAGMIAEEGANDWHNLAYVEFYIGPKVPAAPGFAAVRYAEPPSTQSSAARSITAQWDFSEAQAEVWLGCHYHGTRVYLLMPVPPAAKTCTVTWGRNEAGVAIPGAVQGIDCQ